MAYLIPLQSKSRSPSRFMVALLFFYGFISWSMPLDIAGIKGAVILPIMLISLVFVLIFKNRPPKSWFLIIFGLLLFTNIVNAYIWEDGRMMVVSSYLITALALISSATIRELDRVVDIATSFLYLVLFGALIGFFIAISGFAPIFNFSYGNDSRIFLYVTTFTNEAGRYIRPSGIYDEPGALSFVVCALAYMRQMLHKSYKKTWLMLCLGLITFSLAHLIFVVIFFLSNKISSKKILFYTSTILLILTISYFFGFGDSFNQNIMKRLQIDQTGRLYGDNRTYQYENAIRIIEDNPEVVFKGSGPDCMFDKDECHNNYGEYGQNPLSLMVGGGLLNFWPYYIFLITGFVGLLRLKSGFLFYGITLLFLQRPYLLSLGYSLLGVISIWLHINYMELNLIAERKIKNNLRDLQKTKF